jgi:hypothetical protein
MPNALQTTRAAANEGQRGADALYAAAVGLWREQQRDEAIKLMDEALRLVSTPCSLGELIDKITILRIKAERIGEPEKLANVRRELNLLERSARKDGASVPPIDLLTRSARCCERAPVGDRRRASDMRARRRLRIALRRARAISVLRKRYPRGDKTRHQHVNQLGLGRGEELVMPEQAQFGIA